VIAPQSSLALKFEASNLWTARGNALSGLRRYDEALAAYDRALAIEPELVEALLHRGNCLREMERYDEAIDAYHRVLSLKTDLAPAWFACGALFAKQFRHKEAATAYAQALKIDQQYPWTKGILLHSKMLYCDWEGMEEAIEEIEREPQRAFYTENVVYPPKQLSGER